MALGVGVSDILAGARVAWRIYETGFVEENRADVQYRNFRNDIQGFAQLLEKLEEELRNAHLRFAQRPLEIRAAGSAHNPMSAGFDAERRRIVGDFTATLSECEHLLAENRNLHQRRSTVFQNLNWNLFTREKIEVLRKRIQFHSSKIMLVIDRLSFKLLTDLDARVDDLVELAEQNLAVSYEIRLMLDSFYNSWIGASTGRPQTLNRDLQDQHLVSLEIGLRFSQHARLFRDRLPIPNFPRNLPLVEAFDALLLHFEKSLEDTGRDQTPEQYLSLLKSRWLTNEVKLSEEYEAARPGFYYKRAVAKIERAIHIRLRSDAIVRFDDDVLLTLPDASFAIWEHAERMNIVDHSPTVARANEKEVLQLDLVTEVAQSQNRVTILQSSDLDFRIVKTSLTGDRDRSFFETTYIADEDRLIPRYAIPWLESPRFEIAIFSRRRESLYRFHNLSDMFLFQSALMGYQVSHYEPTIKCKFSAAELNCAGQVQIWQDPIDSRINRNTMPTSPILTDSRSGSSRGSNLRRTSTVSSVAPSTVGRVQDGYQAREISYPAITIFTVLNDSHARPRLAFIYIKLDQDIRLFTEHCGCGDSNTYHECALLSIERPREAKFTVRVLFSDLDSTRQPDPNTWDLSILRIPEHPRFRKLQKVETTFLSLHFSSLTAKIAFHNELNDRFRLREAQRLEQRRFLVWMTHRQDRPTRDIDEVPHPHTRSASFASTNTNAIRARAQLHELDLGADFQVSFEGGFTESSDDINNDDNRLAPNPASPSWRTPIVNGARASSITANPSSITANQEQATRRTSQRSNTAAGIASSSVIPPTSRNYLQRWQNS